MFKWQRHSQSQNDIPHFQELLDFIDRRAQASEVSRSHLPHKTKNEGPLFQKKPQPKQVPAFPSTTTNLQSDCVLCKTEKHLLYTCSKFKEMSHEDKRNVIKVNKMCMNCLTPGHQFKSSKLIHRSDPNFGIPGQIDALLGVDIFVEALLPGLWSGCTGSPVAFETRFGWALAGSVEDVTPSSQVNSYHVSLSSTDDVLLKFCEMEEAPKQDLKTKGIFDQVDCIMKEYLSLEHAEPVPHDDSLDKPVNEVMHIELASDLTTEASIACLRYFISRRGYPKLIWSDYESNFVGANLKLKARSPHFGGIWEAAVKSTKSHLKKIISNVKLTYEEFSTVLSQIKACLNSRPLTPLNSTSEGIEVLTPGHILIGRPIMALPDCTPSKPFLHLLKRWQLCQTLVSHFWKRWSSEYISTLNRSNKWTSNRRNLTTGDIVLLHEDNVIPTQWPLAKVIQTHPGEDGLNYTYFTTDQGLGGQGKMPHLPPYWQPCKQAIIVFHYPVHYSGTCAKGHLSSEATSLLQP
uniref:DUF5641 domain-containing protein n=1 Tax=Amphimedon queenslandica TaxID=400682 RepID=A0A1X7TFI7_AMPQE